MAISAFAGLAHAIIYGLVQSTKCGCSSVDRVLASEAKGRGFDPRQPRHMRFLLGNMNLCGVKILLYSEFLRRDARVAKGGRL